LHQLHAAYGARMIDQGNRDLGPMTAIGWSAQLAEYVKTGPDIFICPEDEGPFNTHSERLQVAISRRGGSIRDTEYWVDVQEGPAARRISQTQLELALQQGWRDFWERWRGFEEDDNPRIYWIMVEDMSASVGYGDRDYNDVWMRFTETAEGLTVSPRKGSTGYRHHLVRKAEPYVDVLEPPGPIEPNHDREQLVASGTSSYGMNLLFAPGRNGRVMLMDYDLVHVDPIDDDWSDDEFVGDDGRIRHARHVGHTVNALIDDGAVQLHPADDLNPAYTPVRRRFWLPVDYREQ
jgi:hypothetical protein